MAAADEVYDADLAERRVEYTPAAAGVPGREIGRPQNIRAVVEKLYDVPPSPCMVSQRDNVCAVFNEVFRLIPADPENGGVFAVDHGERDVSLFFYGMNLAEQKLQPAVPATSPTARMFTDIIFTALNDFRGGTRRRSRLSDYDFQRVLPWRC
jgi:hypothetical protein